MGWSSAHPRLRARGLVAWRPAPLEVWAVDVEAEATRAEKAWLYMIISWTPPPLRAHEVIAIGSATTLAPAVGSALASPASAILQLL